MELSKVTGLVVGNLDTRVGDELRKFKDRLTVLLVGLLFVLLAADVALDDVRALVVAAVASLTAATLESQGVEGGQALKAIVFLVIAATVIVSCVAGRPLVGIRGVRLPRRARVTILGARGLALALADQLKAADIPVVFLESNPKRSR